MYFKHFDLEMFMDALHLPKFNAWLYIFFFYRNRCGRIWSNMSSQPKRVFKLGYHIEYYTFFKKNGTFFISFNMSWNTIYRHFIKWRYILQTKNIFLYISFPILIWKLPTISKYEKKPALTFHYLFSTFKLFKSLCLVYSQ